MESLPVLVGEFVDLSFPFIELAKRHRIPIQLGQASPIVKDQFGDQRRIVPAMPGEVFSNRRAAHDVKKRMSAPVTEEFLFHRCDSKKFLGIIETPMRHVAHERQNDLHVLSIDIRAVLDSLADEP